MHNQRIFWMIGRGGDFFLVKNHVSDAEFSAFADEHEISKRQISKGKFGPISHIHVKREFDKHGDLRVSIAEKTTDGAFPATVRYRETA